MYKLAIRDACDSFEDGLSDDMYKHFVNKNPPEFWKSWNSIIIWKECRLLSMNGTMNGKTEDVDIVNEFACYFSSVV